MIKNCECLNQNKKLKKYVSSYKLYTKLITYFTQKSKINIDFISEYIKEQLFKFSLLNFANLERVMIFYINLLYDIVQVNNFVTFLQTKKFKLIQTNTYLF